MLLECAIKPEFSEYANTAACDALFKKHGSGLAKVGLSIGILPDDPFLSSFDDIDNDNDTPAVSYDLRLCIKGSYVFFEVLDGELLNNTLNSLISRSANESIISLGNNLAAQGFKEHEDPLKASEFRKCGDKILGLLSMAGVDKDKLSAITRRMRD